MNDDLTRGRRRPLRLAALLAVALTALGALPPAPVAASSSAPLVVVRHGIFTVAGHPLPYLHGINYEGPSDRPWRMWEDGKFSPALVAHDFDLMAAAGYNPVRIFIQRPLPSMILDGDYSRLDAVVALAAARGLRLLITFNDDGDRDLGRVARVEARVAAHLAGNPSVFGYDLRNEPGLLDVAGSAYPAGVHVPLLSHDLIAAYHERVSMRTARTAANNPLYAGMDTSALYYYLNVRSLFTLFLRANPGYPVAAPTPYWARFARMIDGALSAYLSVQLAAVHGADPGRPVTVGYDSRFWAALPANRLLDFRSIHVYPPSDFDGFHQALRDVESLNALASTPLVLEEYGVSNDVTGPQSSAVREMAMALYLRTLGGAGDMKWMFNDDAVGYSAYQNNLGAVDVANNPKPTYLASAAADRYWTQTSYAGGLILRPDPVSGAGFVFVARDALAVGGSLPYADSRVAYTPATAGVAWLDWSTPGLLRISATTSGRLTLNVAALTGAVYVAPVPTVLPSPTATPSSTPIPMASATPTARMTPTTASATPTARMTPTTASATPVVRMTPAAARQTPTPAWPSVPTATSTPILLPVQTTTPPASPTVYALTPAAPSPSPTRTGGLRSPLPAAVGMGPWAARAGTPTGAGTPLATRAAGIAAALPTVTGNRGRLTLTVRPGVPLLIHYRASGPLPRVPVDLPHPDPGTGWYMVARGHSVAPPFLAPWLALGGAAGAGLPLTEVFAYKGLPTQYFDDLALRLGPHGITTAPLGLVALSGNALPRAREMPKKRAHYYDRATGHNIHGSFLGYWRATGGLRFWGDPLSEERVQHGHVVQYFTGGAFTLAPHGIGLLPLGRTLWPSTRKVYGL